MAYSIEICVTEDSTTSDKGSLLENLSTSILKIQQFEVIERIKVTGMEIDILAKHKVNNTRILVECKAWEQNIPADVISKLLGEVELRGVDEGWLISTGPLSKDAEGIRSEWENRVDTSRRRLSFYTSDRIIDQLLSSREIVDIKVIKERIKDTLMVSDDQLLIVTDMGKFWLIPIISKSAMLVTSILVFNAQSGHRIRDKGLIDKIKLRKNSYSDCEWLTGETPDNRSAEKLMEEYDNIVPVISGDDWADYRPARPEDFVGRVTLIHNIFSYFDSVIDGNSATRLFSIKAPSGMGKSSVILKITSMSQSRRKSKSYFVHAVDVRTAMSTRYAEMALKSCIDKADSVGFTDTNKRVLEYTGMLQYLQSESLSRTFTYLKQTNRLIVLIFDQFEELFSKKELFGLFEGIKKLCNIIDASKCNFVLGFAWKTDLSVPAEHPAYYMWSNLADRRKEFDVLQFKQSEIKRAINVFGKQLGEKINPVLNNYLAKQCQGYPWLLKKLCIHVYNLITEGVDQETVIGEKLNIVDLFQRDLSELSTEENSCVTAIAKDTPADFFKVADIYGDNVIKSLTNKRIVIRRGSKLVLYWDIFRDYVINKTVPTIVLDYIPQQPFSSLSKMISTLIENGSMATQVLSQSTGLNPSTIDNLMVDAVMFGVAKKEKGIISLTVNSEENIIDILQNFFKRHVLFLQLQSKVKTGEDYAYFSELFDRTYRQSNISDKTRRRYCSKMYNWLTLLGLLYEREGRFYINDSKPKNISLLGVVGRRRRPRYRVSESQLFWGQTSPKRLIEAYNLILSGINSNAELKAKGLRNAVEILSTSQAIRREGDKILLLKKLSEIMQFVADSPTIIFCKKELEKRPNITSKMLGAKVGSHFARDWSIPSTKRYGNALLNWTKYILQEKRLNIKNN